MNTIGVAIVGGTGFGAGELLRYFASHPLVDVVSVVSSSCPGQSIAAQHPHLYSHYEAPFDAELDTSRLSPYQHRFVFLALPHGQSCSWVLSHQSMLDAVKLIDLSADFRLADQSTHEATYPTVPFHAELRRQFCLGMSEIVGPKIAQSRLIANPGCLATACTLAAKPLIVHALADVVGTLCFDAKTGTSGAGRKAQDSMHHPIRHSNFEAYKVLAHRHEPEFRQALEMPPLQRTMFVPHLLPCVRGIYVTLYAELSSDHVAHQLVEQYHRYYQDKPFIRIREGVPTLHDVAGTNYCDIAVHSRGSQLVVTCSLDNLGKGMAGQAIQNMNLMCGIDETSGLLAPSMGPL